jgi:hypothetical protein
MMAPESTSAKHASERLFFFYAAVAVFVTVVAGFGSQLVTRHVWFTDFPWQVHVHSVIFSSWIVLYAVQNWLIVDSRNVALHRRLGWAGAGIAAVMVPLGISATLMAIARGSITSIFPLGLFLTLDVLHIIGFGALTFAAIRLRRQAGWHKRLMLCGTVLATAPALSRLFGFLPLGSLTPLAVIAALLLFIAAGIAFDLTTWRRVHPAYWWGMGVVVLVEMLIVPIGFSSPVVAFANRLAS